MTVAKLHTCGVSLCSCFSYVQEHNLHLKASSSLWPGANDSVALEREKQALLVRQAATLGV